MAPRVRMRSLLPRVFSSGSNLVLAATLIALLGCASSPQTERGSTAGRTDAAPARPNILRIAATVDVSVFHDRLKPTNDNHWDAYVNGGLAQLDDKGIVQPMLL